MKKNFIKLPMLLGCLFILNLGALRSHAEASVGATASDTPAPSVHLTDGGSYVTIDGTSITCTGRIIKKDVACYCDRNNVLVLVRTLHSGTDYLASFKSANECLKAVRERADCN